LPTIQISENNFLVETITNHLQTVNVFLCSIFVSAVFVFSFPSEDETECYPIRFELSSFFLSSFLPLRFYFQKPCRKKNRPEGGEIGLSNHAAEQAHQPTSSA